MPKKQNFNTELAALQAVRELPPEDARPEISRVLLLEDNNYLVSKAADIALHHQTTDLTGDLVSAFWRFMKKPDPQCWAKNSLSKTLAAFEYDDSELFLAGMRHYQPGSGRGADDSAAALRSTCALALVRCSELNDQLILAYLIPLFVDKELSVRVSATRAVARVGSDAATLLLRLRAELASDGPEVLGACFTGVLSIEGEGAIPWAAKFMIAEDDPATEAAMSIAETHTHGAWTLLHSTYQSCGDARFASSLLLAIALTRQEEATKWLFKLVEGNGKHAEIAREGLCRSAPDAKMLLRLQQLGKPC